MDNVKKEIRALLTSAGSLAMPLFAEEARKHFDAYLVGTDIREDAHGLYYCDKKCITLRSSEPGFEQQIVSICRDNRCSLIVPLSTNDQNFFSQRKDLFRKLGIQVLCSSEEAIKHANNKLGLYEFLNGKVDCLPFYRACPPLAELEKEFENLPFVVKQRAGTGAQGSFILAQSPQDLSENDRQFYLHPSGLAVESEQRLIKTDNYFLMEYLPGDEYSVDCFSNEGKLFYSVVRLRLNTWKGLALTSCVVQEPVIAAFAKEIVEHLQLSYVNNIQFKRNSKGEVKLLEINPRMPGTLALSVAAGGPFIRDMINLGVGVEPTDEPPISFGMRYFRYWSGVAVHEGERVHS